jgi:hypothetical protein
MGGGWELQRASTTASSGSLAVLGHTIWPPDSVEAAQAFPRTVYLESRYGTQCSPRSLFSHSIILAAYTLATTPAGDRVNVRNALP